MSIFALVRSDMTRAASAAEDSADAARGADGADALATLAAGLPGSTISTITTELGNAWNTGVDEWADGVDAFGVSISSATGDADGTDGSCGGFLDHLLGLC